MAHLLHYTRKALVDAKLAWKEITYTCKYNAVYNDTNRPTNFTKLASDGELLEIAEVLRSEFKEELSDVLHQVNIMFYDTPPKDINSGEKGPQLPQYKQLLDAASQIFPERLGIHMGFETGK